VSTISTSSKKVTTKPASFGTPGAPTRWPARRGISTRQCVSPPVLPTPLQNPPLTSSPPKWATRSSALAYRAQNGGAGGFAYDYTLAPSNLPALLTVVKETGTLDSLHAIEGVYNISVCDMGTHSDWNGDFTQKLMTTTNSMYNSGSLFNSLAFFFPCCCGPGCTQTAEFIRSSNMENFRTIFDTCVQQMSDCDAWPQGVTEIDYGGAGKIKREPQGYGNLCTRTVDLAANNWLSPGD